jgi:hypothetical protein
MMIIHFLDVRAKHAIELDEMVKRACDGVANQISMVEKFMDEKTRKLAEGFQKTDEKIQELNKECGEAERAIQRSVEERSKAKKVQQLLSQIIALQEDSPETVSVSSVFWLLI